MATLKLRHVKGFACNTRGSMAASPADNGVFFYAAGSILVVCNEDDPTSQSLLRGHSDNITALSVSSNGALIATGSCGKNSDVVVWDVASQQELFRLCEHDFEVSVLEFSPDNRLLLSIGNHKDEKIYVWDMKTGNVVARTFVPKGLNADPQRVLCGAWTPVPGPQGYLLASAGDPDIHLWHLDPYKGDIRPERVVPGSVVRKYTRAVFSPDGQWLYVGTTSGDVVAVNVSRKSIQVTHPVCSLGVGAMLHVDGEILVAGGDGSITKLRPLEMRSCEKPRAMLPGGITSLSRTADGSALIAGTSRGRIVRVEIPSMSLTVISATHEAAVSGASYRGDCLATCSEDATIRLWDVHTMELRAEISNPSKRSGAIPNCVHVSDQGEVLSGWSDGQLWCHDLSGGLLWNIHSTHVSPNGTGVTAVNLAHSGKFVVTGGANGDVRVWDKGSRELVSHLVQHKDIVCDVKVYNDDSHIISGSRDGTFVIWDVFGESRISSHYCPTGGFTGLELAPDQVQVVTVGLDCKLQFWDVRHQTPLQVIDKCHLDVCTALATNLNCDLVVTGAADWGVRLWDYESGNALSGDRVHSGTVNRLVFSDEDDSTIVSVGQDGFIVFWDVLK